jgi:hypothetical protein
VSDYPYLRKDIFLEVGRRIEQQEAGWDDREPPAARQQNSDRYAPDRYPPDRYPVDRPPSQELRRLPGHRPNRDRAD